jgi:signal transduction histidine kinase
MCVLGGQSTAGRAADLKRRRVSLRMRLLVGDLLVLAPLFLLLVFQLLQDYARREEAVLQGLLQTAGLAGVMVDRSFDMALATAGTLAQDSTLRSQEPSRLQPYLRGLLTLRPELANLVVVGPEGQLVAFARGEPAGALSLADRDYFQQVRTAQAPVLSPVLVGRFLEEPIVVAAAPLRDAQGAFQGALLVSLRMGDLAQRIQDVPLHPGQAVFLADPAGRLAFHTGLPSTAWGVRDLSGQPAVRGALAGQPVLTLGFEGLADGEARAAALLTSPRHGWLVSTTWQEEAALGATTRAWRGRMLLFATVALLSLLGVLAVSGHLAGRLRRLLCVVREISEGKLGLKVELDGRGPEDEIDELSRAFNEMSTALLEERRRREHFVASVAHDLRNLMTPLALSAQSIRRLEALPLERQERLGQQVLQQTRRMSRLVSDLFDLSRIQEGRFQLEVGPVDLMHLVHDVVDEQPPAERSRIRVEGPATLLLEGDAERLLQLLTNLLTNALKYSPKDSPVWLRVEPHEQEVVLSVRDEGLGLTPEDVTRLFQPYSRLHEERAVPGTGMGLFICRIIVEAHRGHIRAESPGPNQGSTFTCVLPRQPPPRSAG